MLSFLREERDKARCCRDWSCLAYGILFSLAVAQSPRTSLTSVPLWKDDHRIVSQLFDPVL